VHARKITVLDVILPSPLTPFSHRAVITSFHLYKDKSKKYQKNKERSDSSLQGSQKTSFLAKEGRGGVVF
jgi:hypothetical protein